MQNYKLFPYLPNLFLKWLIERPLDFRLGGAEQRGWVGCVGKRAAAARPGSGGPRVWDGGAEHVRGEKRRPAPVWPAAPGRAAAVRVRGLGVRGAPPGICSAVIFSNLQRRRNCHGNGGHGNVTEITPAILSGGLHL